MAIPLGNSRGPGLPVLKRRTFGEVFDGGIVDMHTRPLMRDGKIEYRDDGATPKQELVITVRAITSNMVASIGDAEAVPAEGDLVRIIVNRGAYRDWINANRAFEGAVKRGLQVGDVVRMTTTHAVRYPAMHNDSGPRPELGTLGSIEDLNLWVEQNPPIPGRPPKETLGWRGEIKIRPAKGDEANMVAACEQAYVDLKERIALSDANAQAATVPAGGLPPAGDTAAGGDDEFF